LAIPNNYKNVNTPININTNNVGINNYIEIVDQGAWMTKGKRSSQEDAYVLHEVYGTNDKSYIMAGVFDGHLGAAASTFVQTQLPTTFSDESLLLMNRNNMKSTSEQDNTTPQIATVLEKAWDIVCTSYRESCLVDFDNGGGGGSNDCAAEYDPKEGILQANIGSKDAVAGTTANVVTIDTQDGIVTVLNCGDSRSIIVDDLGRLYFQTIDHKPENEYDRFVLGQQLGYDYSLPECKFNTWRVAVGDYDYAVARSLEGQYASSKGIVSTPDITSISLSGQSGMTLFIATDGFWEVIDSQEAAMILHRLRKHEKLSASEAAKKLCSLALQKGTSDNVSTVALYFK
jgi:serine/threonine protein phosphatase PrpC